MSDEERSGRFVIKVDTKVGAQAALPPADSELDPDFALKAAMGYVQIDGGPTCGNCEYQKDGKCFKYPSRPFAVDLVKGCCSLWEGDDSPEGEAAEDWLKESENDEDES